MDICSKYVDLHDKIKNIKIAMLTLHDQKGNLRSMPMTTMQTECEGFVWFFTNLDSEKVDEINLNPTVNISYTDRSKEIFVSISGKAETIKKSQKISELWKPYMEEWIPGGLENKDLALLRVEMQQAEYWNGNKMVEIWDFTASVKSPEMLPGNIYS